MRQQAIWKGRVTVPSRWSVYTPRNWYCPTCGRTGIILQHRNDTPERADERRLCAHGTRQRICAGDGLRWTTADEDVVLRAVGPDGLPPLE